MQENEDELFGEMWQDLEVPDSSFSSLSSSSSPSSDSSPSTSIVDSTPSISIVPPPSSSIVTSSFEITSTNEIQQPLISLASIDSISSKKRKTPEGKENKHSPHTWQDYSFGPQTSSLVDSITLEQMSDNIDVAAQIVNPNCFYSNEHGAWVCYRQNQFKVFCMFKGPDLHTMCVNDKGIPRRIEAMCAKLYGVKEVAGVHGDGMRVGLHKVGKNRLKSAKNDVEISPFVKGKIEFSNLQFEKSNAAKKPQPQTEYFHIVLILYAKSENTMFPVLSKISAKIVVRGQNPGFYKDEENVSNTTSRIFATPQSLLGMQMDEFSNNNNGNFDNNVNYDNNGNFDNNANLDNNGNFVYDSTSAENSDNSPSHSPLHHSSLHHSSIPSSLSPSSVPTSISPSSVPSISPGISPSVSPYITPELSPLSPSSVSPPNPNAILSTAMDYSSPYPFTTPIVPTFQNELSEIENILLKKSYDTNIVYNRKEKEIPSWMQDGNTVYHYGRVGINTSVPMEALTVHGNMLVTGDIYKPSDRRIKSQFEIVDSTSQLGRIRQLKIYDYCVQNRQERGVIAQELATIMPEAVHGVGDAEFGSISIPNLLVVNERTLLYENLGATKQLDHDLQYEKAHVVNLSSQVEEITETTNKQNSEMQGTLHSVVDSLFREEHKKKINYAGLEEEFVNFQFSVFRMGPARSLFILGHFASWFWVIGSLFIFSNVRYRKILGWCSFIRLILTWRLFTSLHPIYAIYYDLFQVFIAFFGMIFAIIVLRLNHTRLKRQFKFPNLAPPPPPTSWWGKVKEEICVCLFY